MIALVAADRVAMADAMAQRRMTLRQLAATVHSDTLVLRAATRQLNAARLSARRSKATEDPTLLAELMDQVTQLRQAMQTDAKALATARRTDFTGVHAASMKIRSDLHALNVLRKSLK
jgi:hypothetical protein